MFLSRQMVQLLLVVLLLAVMMVVVVPLSSNARRMNGIPPKHTRRWMSLVLPVYHAAVDDGLSLVRHYLW
jgi:hypothetical protein